MQVRFCLSNQVCRMLLDTARYIADIILDSVLDRSLRVVSLHEVKLRLLSQKGAAVLPGRRVGFVDVVSPLSREFEVTTSVRGEWNAESMAEVRPDPFAFRVEVLEDWTVVVFGVVDDFEDWVEIHRLPVLC